MAVSISKVTPCQIHPWKCQPRHVEHVALDADGVLWTMNPHVIASNVRGPFRKIDDDTVEGQSGYGDSYQEPTKKPEPPSEPGTTEGLKGIVTELVESVPLKKRKHVWFDGITQKQERLWDKYLDVMDITPPSPETSKPAYKEKSNRVQVKLLPTLRDTLEKLNQKGIKVSVISLNTPGSVRDILKAFGIDSRFIEIRDSWKNKGDVFQEITNSHKLLPCNSIFVDDTVHHVVDVTSKCGLALHMGYDISKPADIFKYIR